MTPRNDCREIFAYSLVINDVIYDARECREQIADARKTIVAT
jgi:hypothetical protein